MQTEQLRYARSVQPVEQTGVPDHRSPFSDKLTESLAQVYFGEKTKAFTANSGTLSVSPSSKNAKLPEGHADMAQVFRSELSAAVSDMTHDVDPRSDEGKRVSEMAPALTGAILGGSLIEGVQSSHLVEVAKWAVAASKNPDIISRTTIRTGLGGSDDPEMSMRLPAYALPALDVWSRLHDVQTQREAVLEKRKLMYVAKQVVQPRHADELDQASATEDRARKKELFTQINQEAAALLEEYEFDEETQRDLEAAAGIFEMPKIEFFTASNAAITVNEMDSEKVMANTKKSQDAIGEFTRTFYPEAVDSLTFRTDAPLVMANADGTLTREGLVVSYLENLLERYDGEDVLAVMDTLRKRGVNHAQGDEVRAELYAALHPVLFADRMEVPVVGNTRPRDAAVANITIGGKPERLFNEIRTLLSDKAESGDFVEFAGARLESGDISEKDFAVIQRWAGFVNGARKKYEKGDIADWTRPDLPAITLPLITKVGQTPVYYRTRADVPLTATAVQDVRTAGGFDQYFDAKREADEAKFGPPPAEEKAKIGHAITDTAIILNRPGKDGSTLLPAHINDDTILDFFEEFTATHS